MPGAVVTAYSRCGVRGADPTGRGHPDRTRGPRGVAHRVPGRALREGVGPESARAAAPHLRALTGAEEVILFDGEERLLVRDPTDDPAWAVDVIAACERAARDSMSGHRRVPPGDGRSAAGGDRPAAVSVAVAFVTMVVVSKCTRVSADTARIFAACTYPNASA